MYLTKEKISDIAYKKKFLCGICSYKLNFKTSVVTYKFFGIKFMTKVFYRGVSKYTLFKFIHFHRNAQHTADFLLPILVERLKQITGMESFDIIPLQYRLGETLLLLSHMDSWIKNSGIKNPIFVSNLQYLKSLCEMYCPNIPFIQISPLIYNLHWADISNKDIKGVRYFQNLSRPYFIKFENSLLENPKQFYDAHTAALHVPRTNTGKPLFSANIIDSAETKLRMLGLKKPFVFITPDAKSNGTMTKEFWDKLPLELYKLGYDMFFNTIPWKMSNSFYKHCFLNIAEAKYVAEAADVIIGVRSGLMDVIANKKSKIFCVYHAFWDRGDMPALSTENVMTAFTLKQLPNVNPDNIFEYNGEIEDEKYIISDIVKHLQKEKVNVS